MGHQTMARRKKSSATLEKSERRAAGLKSIDGKLDLGNDLSLDNFSTLIDKMRSQLEDYNSALSTIDKLYNGVLETERELADLSEHMLLGVASKYGKSSNEYEMAGGVRKSDRRRARRGVQAALIGHGQPIAS